MNNTIKNLIIGWGDEKVREYTQYLPVIPVEKINHFWERDAGGVYLVRHNSAVYIKNDCSLETVSKNDSDFVVLKDLYSESQSTDVIRLAKPVKYSIDGEFLHIDYETFDTKVGMPTAADVILSQGTYDIAWAKQFVDQVAWILQTLRSKNHKFPVDGISLIHRLKDSRGYFYYNLVNFNYAGTDDEFVKFQLEILRNDPGWDYFNFDPIELFNYAELKWKK